MCRRLSFYGTRSVPITIRACLLLGPRGQFAFDAFAELLLRALHQVLRAMFGNFESLRNLGSRMVSTKSHFQGQSSPIRQPPQKIDGEEVPSNASTTLLTMPWNLTGQPAASLPCGFSRKGLPVGLQIIGRLGEDSKVLQASADFEQARPWADVCDRKV